MTLHEYLQKLAWSFKYNEKHSQNNDVVSQNIDLIPLKSEILGEVTLVQL